MKSIQIILAKEKKSLSIWTPNDEKKNHHILHVLICDWCMYGMYACINHQFNFEFSCYFQGKSIQFAIILTFLNCF